MCLLYGVCLRVGCVEYYTVCEGCVCVFCWKTADLVRLTGLNAALAEWHSETGLKWRSIGMKRLTKIMTAIMFACSIPIFAAAASFNCSKASTANEIAICSDDELSSLDETLAAVYKQARGSVSDAKRLKSEQINWIKSLGTCDGNAVCLISAYKTRIVILDYLDGKIAVKVDPLQDRITQLNEREEILAQRENAFTTELRALDSEIERFEEEKLAFANAKNAPLKVEEVSEEVPNTRVPCISAGMSSKQIESGYKTVLQVVEMYNSRNSVNEKMEIPVSSQCFVSTRFLPKVSFYPNSTYASCAAAENCTGKYEGYFAGIIKWKDSLQISAGVGRGSNMVRLCNKNGNLFEGSCL